MPIYVNKLANILGNEYKLEKKDALAATAVAIKRVMDKKLISNLRFYQKGIYYLTKETVFGEIQINKQQLIEDKYIENNCGYETDFSLLYKLGLTNQIPKNKIIATNAVKECVRKDKKLGVIIRPPKTKITANNKEYLKILDVLNLLKKIDIDKISAYKIIADYIKKYKLYYDKLIAIADKYYNKNTVLELAHTISREI
jgi:hypothetical protein